MSILDSLKVLDRPIKELAKLPQQTIMQLAQNKQIPMGFVAPILSEKAEQAKTGAELAAVMQSQELPPSSILERVIAQNAAAESSNMAMPQQFAAAPQEMPAMEQDVGIASLPVSENMMPDEFAGGGIVAFAAGGKTPTFEEILAQAERGEGPYVSRPQGNAPMDRVLRTLTEEQRRIYDETGKLPPGAQSMITPRVDPNAKVEKEVVRDDYQPANLRGIDTSNIIRQAEGIASALRPRGERGVPSIQEAAGQTDELLAVSGYDPNVFKKLQEDVQAQRESLKGDRKESINMRLIEAGLAIMGGSSPYAFENIGKGATGAVKGLAEDFKDLRKSERDLLLAEQNLALKQNENAMGKARVTQATIDKAQDRVDRETDNYNKTKAEMAKTLLAGDIQERLAKASYSTKMTDFDKQWRLYSAEAKANGENPTFSGFQSYIGDRPLTMKDALNIASKETMGEGSVQERAKALLEADRNYRLSQRGGAGQRTNLSAQDQQALNWANSNPNDPRAKQIKDYLGAR